MNCKKAREHLGYLGGLGPDEKIPFLHHIRTCQSCREVVTVEEMVQAVHIVVMSEE